MANDDFVPKLVDEQDDEFTFELRAGVFVAVRFGSEKKLRFQMWREMVMLPADEGNIFTQSFRDRLVAQTRDGFNEAGKPDNIPHIAEDIGKLATLLGHRGDGGKSMQEKLAEQEGASITDRLVRIAEEGAKLFRTPEQIPHAVCRNQDHQEILLVESREFRTWLRGEYRRRERERLEEIARVERERMLDVMGALAPKDLAEAPLWVKRPQVIPPASFATAMEEIKATAMLEGPMDEVHLRAAGHDGKVYVDLCNEKWEAVEIDKEGWKVIPSDNLPVKFVRSNAMKALPHPVSGGSILELRQMLTLPEESSEESWSLIMAWVMQALVPCEGDYPILVLLGGHGTAKSTHTEMLRELVDPAVVEHEHEKTYHEVRAVYIEVTTARVLALDNVSQLPDWLSDVLCRVSSGGGFKTRALFTNRDQEIFKGKRPIIMNGISDVVKNSDILDRSLLVDLPPISGKNRKEDKVLWAEFNERRPRILGALFDAVAAGLKKQDEVVLEDEHRSRLIDFDRWAVATEKALGIDPGTYVKARKLSRESASETALEAQPVWRPLYAIAAEYDEGEPWLGTMKELLDELNSREPDAALRRSKDWPKTERKLSSVLGRIKPDLIERGVHLMKAAGSRREGRRYKMYSNDDIRPSMDGDG
jgi:hypothetical protein